jgi:hypothetical protein
MSTPLQTRVDRTSLYLIPRTSLDPHEIRPYLPRRDSGRDVDEETAMEVGRRQPLFVVFREADVNALESRRRHPLGNQASITRGVRGSTAR